MACRAVLEAARAAQAYPRPTARDLVVSDQILQHLSRHAIGASASHDTRVPGGVGRRELLNSSLSGQPVRHIAEAASHQFLHKRRRPAQNGFQDAKLNQVGSV
jgi:hypothetical protein